MRPHAPGPRLGALLRSRAFLGVAALWLAGAGALCLLPLTGTPGFFHALGLTLLLGSLGLVPGVLAARIEQRIFAPRPDPHLSFELRRPKGSLSALGLPVAVAFAANVLLMGVGLGIGLLSGLRVGTCDLAHGLWWYLLLPLPSALLAATVGVLAGALLRRRWTTGLLLAGTLLASLAVTAWPVATGPQAFGFNHLLGYVPGPIYDESASMGLAVLGYRALTLGWVLLLLGLGALHLDRRDLRLRTRARSSRWIVAVVVLGAVLVAGLTAARSTLGFQQSSETVARALGGEVRSEHFIIRYPAERDPEWVRRTVLDHELRREQLVRWLDLEDAPRVETWIFRSREEKQRLIGAGPTSIAKPWLHALYIEDRGHPHPVLKHELTHVLAAAFGRGPFAIASSDGLIPNDGLVEGIAVAADWRADALSVHGWARAMRALGVAPPAQSLFARATFWRHSPARSYTLAGSFLRWLADTRGISAVKAAYGAGDLSVVADPALLFAEWEAFLDETPVGAAELRLAEARFRRPSVVRRPCALDVSRAREAAARARAAAQWEEALTWYGRCVALEPQDPAHLSGILSVQQARGELEAARHTAEQILAHPGTDAGLRASVQMILGDLAWTEGDDAAAAEAFEAVTTLGANADLVRLASAKRLALARSELSPVLRPFLLGQLGRESAVLALHEAFLADPASGLLAYLIGRQLYNAADAPRAVGWLARAVELGLPPDGGLALEGRRLLARARYQSGDLEGAALEFEALAAEAGTPEALAADAADWAERARFERGRALHPEGIP